MPIIEIKLIEGRTVEQKRKIVKAVTDAICESTGVTPDRVRIHLCEMKKENFAKGGVLTSDN